MRSPSSSTLRSAGGAVCFLLACGRSASAPSLSGQTDAGAAGGLIETGGMSGTTSQPGIGGALASGGAEAGGAWASGGAIPRGGDSGTSGGTSGQLGASGGLGRGGASGSGDRMDAAGTPPTGGTTPSSDGATVTGGSIAGADSGAGGSVASGGTREPVAGTGGGGAAGSGGNSGAGGTSGSGGGAGSITFPPKFFGNIDTTGKVRSDFATYWDQLTPENAGKWAAVQSSPSTFNWTSLDAMYKYAEENNILFKEHCFIWGAGPPSWVKSSNAAEAARNWMKTFCDRYPKTRIIDVVNEPLHNVVGYKEGLGGAGTSGWDWIVNSFKLAQEACPSAILVLNDYNIIEYSNEHGKIIDLLKKSLAAGAPIMAVGAESHDLNKVTLTTVQTYLADLVSQTGLPVYITEMDLGISDDAQQAATMKDLVTTFWNDPNVPGITYWGYIVGFTWRANTGLMTSDGTMRPAMTWLMDFLHR
jgi:endo-1,4-beta-xylanase